jgi:hypothetical protein
VWTGGWWLLVLLSAIGAVMDVMLGFDLHGCCIKTPSRRMTELTA